MDNPKSWTIAHMYHQEYRPDTYAPVNVTRYAACRLHHLDPSTHRLVMEKYGQMTEEEAKAMAKLLNATATD